MAKAKNLIFENCVEVAGLAANDVGPVLPYVAVAYAVTKLIVEHAKAAQANQASCAKLAERATSISTILGTYFGTNAGKRVNGTHNVKDAGMIECLSQLESELQSACALVKRFSSAEKWTEKAFRALAAKNFQGEFMTCEARLVELETRLSRIIIFKMAHDHEEKYQNVIGKLEGALLKLKAVPYEMARALEEDRRRDTVTLENKLRSHPEKVAVLGMHSAEVKYTSSYLHAANAGRASNGPEGSEPWYIEATLAEKHRNGESKRIPFVPLGNGGSGNVFKGKFMGQEIAIKEIKSKGNKAMRELRNEVGIMWRLSHENVVQTLGGFYPRTGVKAHEHESPFIVLEFAPKGSLENYMFHDSGGSLLLRDELLRIFRCIIDGLKYLHGNKIIHRDMKPQNILLMDDLTPKICDFGLATMKNSCSLASGWLGTIGYMAPEVIRGDQYNRSCDVWSYGVMLFEMMLGEPMFGSKCTVGDVLNVLGDPKRGVPWNRLNTSEYAKQWPVWVAKLARACLQNNPEERPTVSDIWLEFYERLDTEGAIAAAKSQKHQYAASPSGNSTARVDAVTGNISHVTVAPGGSAASASSVGGCAVGPRGSRPVHGKVQSADEKLCFAEECEKAGNMANAYTYIKQAAEAGITEGQFRLGKILLDGSHGMCQHLEYGAGWVRTAAEKGHMDAMIELGRCYHGGRGLTQTLTLAKEWYARAAKLGSRDGSASLESIEAEERHLRHNTADRLSRIQTKEPANMNSAKAPTYYGQVAEQGGALAQYKLGTCYTSAWGDLVENIHAVVDSHRHVAEQGDTQARNQSGTDFAKDWGGLLENKCASVDWYWQGTEPSRAPAQNVLGNWSANAWGVLAENAYAVVYSHHQGAERGHAPAQQTLGTCSANEWGSLPENRFAMVHSHRQAAEQGDMRTQIG
ncbi:putative cysteine-rich receptor-like protein kinase 39 [Porphyridium purpureum]|uniref:Putative cysteine-rich receptor-like protein kinase 39 n=1 Tax=Porphyridium purpureum TaxID=35688 RepID=A0A5J4Z693_PORPP|nr:putative cysteine-rich receptor-like protein kinase 39 [Porphyridium purpureum]|eukprot:POR4945..scf295_1